MQKISTAAPPSSVLTALRDPQAGGPGLLNVLNSSLLGPKVGGASSDREQSGRRLLHCAQIKAAALGDATLCIIRAENP